MMRCQYRPGDGAGAMYAAPRQPLRRRRFDAGKSQPMDSGDRSEALVGRALLQNPLRLLPFSSPS